MASQTALQVLTDSLRRVGVIQYDESPDASMAADGLVMLNEFMHGLPNESVQYAHRDLALTDTVNMPDGMLRALKLAFCRELIPEYGKPVSPAVAALIEGAFGTLRSGYFAPTTAPVDAALRRRFWYNFSTDRSS